MLPGCLAVHCSGVHYGLYRRYPGGGAGQGLKAWAVNQTTRSSRSSCTMYVLCDLGRVVDLSELQCPYP